MVVVVKSLRKELCLKKFYNMEKNSLLQWGLGVFEKLW